MYRNLLTLFILCIGWSNAYLEESDEYGVSEFDREDPAWYRADRRWEIPWYQSWLILLVLIIVYLSFTGLIYWIEPGIR